MTHRLPYSEDHPAPLAHESSMACAINRVILSLVDDPSSSARALLFSWACTYGYDLSPIADLCRKEAAKISKAPRRAHAALADKAATWAAYGVARGLYGPVPSTPRLNHWHRGPE